MVIGEDGTFHKVYGHYGLMGHGYLVFVFLVPRAGWAAGEAQVVLWSKYSLFHLYARNQSRKAHTFLSEYVSVPPSPGTFLHGVFLVAQVSGRADQDFEGSSGPSLIRGP